MWKADIGMISWPQTNRICVFTYEFALYVINLDNEEMKYARGYLGTVFYNHFEMDSRWQMMMLSKAI